MWTIMKLGLFSLLTLTGCSSIRLGPFHDDPGHEIACGADSDCRQVTRGSLAPGYVCRFLEIDHPAVCVPPDARHWSDADPNYPDLSLGLR